MYTITCNAPSGKELTLSNAETWYISKDNAKRFKTAEDARAYIAARGMAKVFVKGPKGGYSNAKTGSRR